MDAVKKRAALIGAEVKKDLDALKASGNDHLFANIITGWETRNVRDFETGRPLGDLAPFRHLPCLALLQGKDARGIAFPKRLTPHYDERVVGGRDRNTTRVGCRLPASTCRSQLAYLRDKSFHENRKRVAMYRDWHGRPGIVDRDGRAC